MIVYFYPAAMTPGCTTQACDFSDSLESLKADGYTVLGISPDTPGQAGEVPREGGADRHPALRRGPLGDERGGALSVRRSSTARPSRASSAAPSSSTRTGRSRTPSTTSRPPATSRSSAATSDSSEETMSAPTRRRQHRRRDAAATSPRPGADPGARGRDRGPSRPPRQDHRRADRTVAPEGDHPPADRGREGALRRRRDHPRGGPARRAGGRRRSRWSPSSARWIVYRRLHRG